MAKNYSAYEAATVIMGTNVEEIAEVGSRYPVLTRVVAMANTEHLLDILKALPKVTARVVETGLKELPDNEETEEEEVKEVKKTTGKKTSAKTQPEPEPAEEEDEDEGDEYDSMNVQQLYKAVCAKGMSTKIKDRKRATMLEALRAADLTDTDEDDWDDEDEEDTDPYIGKSAQELFKMCKDRKIKARPKMKADAYVKLLKEADKEDTEEDSDEDEDDWEC